METIENEVREGLENIQESATETKEELENVSVQVEESAEQTAEAVEETVEEAQTAAEEIPAESEEKTVEVIEETATAAEGLNDTVAEAEETLSNTVKEAESATEEAVETVGETVSEVSEGFETVLEETDADIIAEAEAAADVITEAAEETVSETEHSVEVIGEEAAELTETVELAAGETAEVIADAVEEQPEIPQVEENVVQPVEEKTFVNDAPPAKASKGSLLKDKRVIIGAVIAAIALALAFIIPAYKKSQTYKQGIEKLHNGEYQEAIDTLAEIEGYKDADQYSAYASGLKAFYNGDLDIARSDLEESGGLEEAGIYTSYIDGVQSMDEGYDAASYQDAANSFTAAGELLDSAGMAVYTQAVSDFLTGNTEAAGTAFRTVISDNAIPSEYVDTAKNVVLYLDSVEKFDKEDFSVKDDFNTVAANDDGLIGDIAKEYVYYIEGKEFYDDKHYYKAMRKFDYCFDIKDAEDLYNSCIQDRPSTGIIYNKNKSSAVSVIIYDNSDGEDLFVKFYDSNDKLVESLYIRDGKNGTAKIASGKHRMALASGDGKEWYGTKDMFGSNGSYQRLQIDGSKEYYNFLKNYEYTLKFNVKDGNVTSQYTDFEDF